VQGLKIDDFWIDNLIAKADSEVDNMCRGVVLWNSLGGLCVQNQSGLGLWLKQRCQQEKLSLRQAAAKTGLSHGTIEGIIKGAAPSPQTIRKLAQAFAGGEKERLALEDQLLTLAGYRTQRVNMKEVSLPIARLLDLVAPFNDKQLRLVVDFADFLIEVDREIAKGKGR
jgi:transcriptional regulator with XRE-family HTH domain